MRRALLGLASMVVLVLLADAAFAAFTTHESNPQTFTALTVPGGVASLRAESRTNDHGASSTQVQYGLRLVNDGSTDVNLTRVEVRYWFTNDGSTGTPVADCYHATFGCGSIRQAVHRLDQRRDDADHFVEVSFTSGRLAPGAAAQLDQLAIRDQTGATYRQRNDHSFLRRSHFTNNRDVTVYVAGVLVWGTEPAVMPVHERVDVDYQNRDHPPTGSAIKPGLQVFGTGTTNIELRHLTLRYWFTRDGGSVGDLVGACDYALMGCNRVTTSFHDASSRRRADTYLEVGFTGGTLGLGGSTGPIQLRVHKRDYAEFHESNDYSWGINTSFRRAPRVTAYLDGRLIWGREP